MTFLDRRVNQAIQPSALTTTFTQNFKENYMSPNELFSNNPSLGVFINLVLTMFG